MNYFEAVAFLESKEKFGINLGLPRVGKLLGYLGDPQKKFKSIVIAGTNGKGSVSAMLSSVLNSAGYRVGMYTSPHFLSYTERVRVNEKDTSEQAFSSAVCTVKNVLEKHGRSLNGLTVFEILTAVAFVIFAKEKIDVAILEVGLGGRLDATNVVSPLLSVITNIDYDHTDILGKRIQGIAREKAGIIKRGVPVITAAEGDALKVICKIAKKLGSKVTVVGTGDIVKCAASLDGEAVSVRSIGGKDMSLYTPLIGAHQALNLALAVRIAEALKGMGFNISIVHLKVGLRRVRWTGRFEIVSKKPLIIVDGAHNPAGAMALRRTIEELKLERPITLILGVQSNKDIRSIARTLFGAVDRVIVTRSSHPNAAKVEVVSKECDKHSKRVFVEKNVEGSIALALDLGPDQTILIAGSLFTIADAMKVLRR
jgi:dihydrofolate synthase/folylpolyglutamate synthase